MFIFQMMRWNLLLIKFQINGVSSVELNIGNSDMIVNYIYQRSVDLLETINKIKEKIKMSCSHKNFRASLLKIT